MTKLIDLLNDSYLNIQLYMVKLKIIKLSTTIYHRNSVINFRQQHPYFKVILCLMIYLYYTYPVKLLKTTAPGAFTLFGRVLSGKLVKTLISSLSRLGDNGLFQILDLSLLIPIPSGFILSERTTIGEKSCFT